MILPSDRTVIDTYIEYMRDSDKSDAWQELYAQAIDFNKPTTEEEFDALADAVTNRIIEVLGTT